MRGSFIGLLIGCFSGAATGVFIQIMTRIISNSTPGFMVHILGLDSSFSPVSIGSNGFSEYLENTIEELFLNRVGDQ
jgi:hypothetical protein